MRMDLWFRGGPEELKLLSTNLGRVEKGHERNGWRKDDSELTTVKSIFFI